MKIKKEYILIVLIIVSVLFLEGITNYIFKESNNKISKQINTIIDDLEQLHDLKDNNIENKELENNLSDKIKKLKSDWNSEENKLSMFAEHNEIEKVTACLVILEENIKNEQYDDALANGKEFVYRLNHVQEKDDLKIKNIF